MTDGTILDVETVRLPSAALSMAKRALSTHDFQLFEAVTLHHVTYASSGHRIKGWLALPPSRESVTHYPAIIFNRGGTGPRGALTDEGAMSMIGYYSSWGYVCVASNYRGTGGSEGAEEWGDGDVDDAMACIPLLDSLDYVDKHRMGLVGGSRGGMMAYMMLTRTKRFRAAVTFGAPTMINSVSHSDYIRKTMVKHLPSDSVEQLEAERRSVVVWADNLSKTTPLLILHGTGDRRVPAEHSIALAAELQKLHHPYKLILYDNADHVLAGRRAESNADIRWWLDYYVRDKSHLPRTGPHGA